MLNSSSSTNFTAALRSLKSILFLFLLTALPLMAEDAILSDRNGDGKLLLIGYGDSITYGVGDGEVSLDGTIPLTDGTRGYLKRVADLTGVETDNFGVPGEIFSVDGISRLKSTVEKSQADVVVLMHGYNDAIARVASNDYRRKLQRAVNIVQSLDRQLVLATLFIPRQEHAYLAPYVAPYSKVVKLLSQANNVPLANVEEAWNNLCIKPIEQGCRLLSSPEGLHPTPSGYDVLSQTITATLLGIDPSTPEGIKQLADATGLEVDDIALVP